jgi:hypothetical protein
MNGHRVLPGQTVSKLAGSSLRNNLFSVCQPESIGASFPAPLNTRITAFVNRMFPAMGMLEPAGQFVGIIVATHETFFDFPRLN